MPHELESLLGADETVIWSGKPHQVAFLLRGVVSSVFGIAWLSFSLFAFDIARDQAPIVATLVLIVFILIGVGLTLGPVVWQVLRYRNTQYVITNRRLITQTGAIGLDTRFVDLEKIQEVYVNVSVFDKIFGTGSLSVVTAGFVLVGKAYPMITALKDPYTVQRLLQDAAPSALTRLTS